MGGHDTEGNASTSYQWSFGIQQEVARDTVVDITYVGNRGTHLGIRPNLNRPAPRASRGNINADRPYPGFGNILWQQPSATSKYHGLELTLKRRFAQGFMYEMAYTFSKNLSHGDNNGDTIQDPLNIAAEWGISDLDRTHLLISNFFYELPFGREQNTLAKKIFGGWTFGGMFTFPSSLRPHSTSVASTSSVKASFCPSSTSCPRRTSALPERY